jgi:integrase
MRKGNILNLKWEQVDLKNGFILLDITKNGERHEIPINNTLWATLLSLQRRLDIPPMSLTIKPQESLTRKLRKVLLLLVKEQGYGISVFTI